MSGDDPDNPKLTIDDISEIMSYEPEAEVARLEEKLDATEIELDRLRQENERLRGEVEKQNENCHQLTQQFESERRSRLGLSSKIGHLTSDIELHKQALEVARVALWSYSNEGTRSELLRSEALTTINNVLKEGK